MKRHLIRSASSSDAAEIARLLTLLGHPTKADSVTRRWEEWNAGDNAILVSQHEDALAQHEDSARLLGVATLHQMTVLHRPKPVGRITSLIVDTSARGQGIGRSLVAAAEQKFSAAGCGLVEITSNLRLAEAHAFYEHLGYERTSVRLAKRFAAT